jgi:SAM-dependent methyltransferase
MRPMLTWQDDERFEVGDTTFRAMLDREGVDYRPAAKRAVDAGDLFVAKPRWRLEGYVQLLDRLRPQRIFELGIFLGGSAALFAEIARPHRLVAIDKRPQVHPLVAEYLTRRGLSDSVVMYGGVDQWDTARLAEIADEAFGEEPIDLVVDDCSHRYKPSRASFNELFPRLRPGGVYVIEDWPWAHAPVDTENDGPWSGQVPLTRLVFEVILAIPGVPGLISGVEIDSNSAYVTRGEAEVDRETFEIAACSKARGRDLLAPARQRRPGRKRVSWLRPHPRRG